MNDREMSLEEFCNKLPPFHRVNKELSALESQIKAEQESVNELSLHCQDLELQLKRAEDSLRNYANENLWDKNTSGFWVYSDRGPYEAREALKGLGKEKPC